MDNIHPDVPKELYLIYHLILMEPSLDKAAWATNKLNELNKNSRVVCSYSYEVYNSHHLISFILACLHISNEKAYILAVKKQLG